MIFSKICPSGFEFCKTCTNLCQLHFLCYKNNLHKPLMKSEKLEKCQDFVCKHKQWVPTVFQSAHTYLFRIQILSHFQTLAFFLFFLIAEHSASRDLKTRMVGIYVPRLKILRFYCTVHQTSELHVQFFSS